MNLAQPDTRVALGRLGERLAREHLERAGYAIVERNFRCAAGELDLVVADARALVFCEVKTRVAGAGRGSPGPLDAIGTAKRRRLRLLAREWLTGRAGNHPRRPEIRFDAVGVTVTPTGRLVALDHLEDAF